MPTTFGSLYPKIYDFNNLVEAYKNASKGKRFRHEALVYKYRLEENLINLQNHLIWHSWQSQPYRYFTVYEPKMREIAAPAFCDRVLHHALVQVIGPLFERRFMGCSFACRKNKGTHSAVDMAEHYLRMAKAKYKSPYIVKGDIKSYFASIPHVFLKEQYRRTIRCKDTLWLMDRIVDTGAEHGVGVPIGALTSQLMANIVLDPLDHYAKEVMGIMYYLRYMDDFIAICRDKSEARYVYFEMERFVEMDIGLKLNPKSRIQPISKGLNFCGYRMWPTHRLPRKRNVRRMRKRLLRMCRLYKHGALNKEAIMQVWASFLGYMKHCNSLNTVINISKDVDKKLKGELLNAAKECPCIT